MEAVEITAHHNFGERQAGSLIFAATKDVQDSLVVDFAQKIVKLKQWLWPYLVQNPYDDGPA